MRHGEATGDESLDPGLSDAGRSQVKALSRRLADEGIDAVWHGPKRRARETGRILAKVLEVDSQETGLLEDGTPVPSARFRGDYSERRLEWFDAVPEEERDQDGVVLAAAWAELCRRAQSRSVVMVTHSFVIAEFVALALGAGPEGWMRLRVSNASLSIIEANTNGDPVVREFNDTCHIRALAADGRQDR